MKATELRLGNYVTQIGELFQVSVDILKEMESHDDVYTPIPLTEEWLIKFGFKIGYWANEGRWFYHPDYGDRDIKNKFILNDIENRGIFSFDWRGTERLATIQYVHQLQNLYFALTGEELAIKKKEIA